MAIGAFPSIVSRLTPPGYWSMAVVATIGLLFSIVFHEISHVPVAQPFGMPIRGITLFIVGGVAELHSEPTSAASEFLISSAGPVASAILGLLFFLLFGFVTSSHGPPPVAAVLWYLSYLAWTPCGIQRLPAFSAAKAGGCCAQLYGAGATMLILADPADLRRGKAMAI